MKNWLLILLLVQLAYAKKIKAKSGTVPAIGTKAGGPTDLTKAEITYSNKIVLEERNLVAVQTNLPVADAVIYMNVTGVCKFDEYSSCIPTGEPYKYLSQGGTTKLAYKGKGLYSGYYTVKGNVIGDISLTFFTVTYGLDGQVYRNREFTGEVAARVHSDVIDYDWGYDPVFGVQEEYMGVRWRGKWIFPETKTYDLRLKIDDTIKIYLDGQLRASMSYSSSYRYLKLDVEAGEHDFVFEYTENVRNARVAIYWREDENSDYVVVPKEYFRSVGSAVVSSNVEVQCQEGYFQMRGTRTCYS